jgi:hypothetical protein
LNKEIMRSAECEQKAEGGKHRGKSIAGYAAGTEHPFAVTSGGA